MEIDQPIYETVDGTLEFVSFQNILNLLPAVVYINELQTPGDPLSCRNVWMNKTGIDTVGYSQEEITQMGYKFYQEIMHPDDLEILPIPLEKTYASQKIPVFMSMQRIRSKGQSAYRWNYTHGVLTSTFGDGSPRQFLAVAMDITDSMPCNDQLVAVLKEIKQLKSSLKLRVFTAREKEILKLITKGKTDKDIASALFISIQTAKKHHTNIIRKAEVKNTAELVALAMESGLY